MSASSAKKIFNYLVTLGLVTEDFAATDRLRQWRMNDSYAEACQAMIDDVYPQDLKDAAPGPKVDREIAKRWFMKTDLGEAQASQCAAMYALISDADLSKLSSSRVAKTKTVRTQNGKPKQAQSGPELKRDSAIQKDAGDNESITAPSKVELPKSNLSIGGPTVHLNLEIHISPDLSLEQIEKVFESMGKHVFSRG